MNKIILIGRLIADPQLRQTQSGISSCRFTLAVDRRFKEKNTGERQADFITCVAWRQTAEFISRYFHKGSMICVEGSLRTGSYTDKNHPDVTHYTTDVFVENAEFCGSKNDSNNSQNQAQTSQQENSNSESIDLGEFEEILSDSVPF
jgi:single-strand DNA-binding protein